MKLLHEAISHDEVVRKRFSQEARLMASLQDPGIVPVFDFGEDRGVYFLVLGYYSGGSLQRALAERRETGSGPFAAEQVVAFLQILCPALTSAHQRGILHRDLKPGNLLLDERGRPAIADFGLARLLSETSPRLSSSNSHSTHGTPLYMSPEQWESQESEIDSRSDLYAVGAIIYELLTGQAPFRASSVQALMVRHLEAPVPRPTVQRKELPGFWDEAVACLLAKRREDRFPSADAMLAFVMESSARSLFASSGPAPVPSGRVGSVPSLSGWGPIAPKGDDETSTWQRKPVRTEPWIPSQGLLQSPPSGGSRLDLRIIIALVVASYGLLLDLAQIIRAVFDQSSYLARILSLVPALTELDILDTLRDVAGSTVLLIGALLSLGKDRAGDQLVRVTAYVMLVYVVPFTALLYRMASRSSSFGAMILEYVAVCAAITLVLKWGWILYLFRKNRNSED